MEVVSHPVFDFVGGEHDTHRAMVTLSAVGIPQVAAHENIHGRICAETCDGSMFASAVRLHRACERRGRQLPAGLSEFVKVVSDNSLFAHESAATYLGVKQYDSSEDRIPEDYEQYYYALAHVIDPVFVAPDVQSAVAWGLTYYAFSSRLIFAVRNGDWQSVVPVSKEDLPDARFHKLLETVSGNPQQLLATLHQVVRDTCSEYGVEPWDLQTEVAWSKTDKHTDLLVEMDDRLVKTTYEWLRLTSDISCIDFDHELKTVHSLLDSLAEPHDVDLPSDVLEKFREAVRSVAGKLDLNNPGRSERRLFDVLREMSAEGMVSADANEKFEVASDTYSRIGVSQADAYISNKDAIKVSDSAHDVLQGDSLFENLSSVRILSAEPPDHMDHWLLVGKPNESSGIPSHLIPRGRYPKQLVLEWLSRRRARSEAGEPVPEVPMVVLALQSSIDPFRLLLQASTRLEREGIVELIAGNVSSSLCWYWRGNFLDCIAEHKENKDLQFKAIIMDRQKSDGQVVKLHVMALLAKGLPGCVVRAYTPHSGSAMGQNILSLYEEGYIVPIAAEDFATIEGVVVDAVGHVSTYWEEF